MKNLSKGTILFYVVLVISVLMVNPPIVYLVNDYCVANPITFGWPTMFLWLELWYTVMVVDFLVAAIKLKAWNCHQDKKEIIPVERDNA
jgi:hypothetical protein